MPTTPDLQQLQPFIVSLAIGLLLGMEREGRPAAKAGLRTFGLVALFGSVAALLSSKFNTAWPLAAGLAGLAGMMIAANWRSPEDDPGTTTVVALLLCFALGALCWLGELRLAVVLAIVAALLLHLKTELHGIASRISSQDMGSVLQFGVLALIVLPILPNQGYGPFNAFNPYHTGLMVVLISAVGLVGYAAMRLIGSEHGVLVAGLLGGLVSSTATTLVFSRRAAADPALARAASVVILLANVTLFARVAMLTFVVAPATLSTLALPLGLGGALALGIGLLRWRSLDHTSFAATTARNPTELPTAQAFALIYSLILLLSAAVWPLVGQSGIYGIAFLGGIPDVDAAALSAFSLFHLGKIDHSQAAIAVGVAMIANLLFKSALIAAIGRSSLAGKALVPMLGLAVAVLAGLMPVIWHG